MFRFLKDIMKGGRPPAAAGTVPVDELPDSEKRRMTRGLLEKTQSKGGVMDRTWETQRAFLWISSMGIT